MKKTITLLLLFIVNITFSQVVCDLTYERTLQTFSVYIHNPSGATMYKAKMYIDSDGSPRSYGPNNSGLDYTANAGSTGNWYGVVSDVNGNPIIQTATDPYPGMYVSTTSLVNSNYGINNPLRYVNSETVPYIAIATNVLTSGNIRRGDVAYVYNTVTGQSCFAIYADAGNTTSIGEASVLTASLVGVNPNVRTGGTSLGIIDYVVFPQSGFGQGYIPTIAQIDSMGNSRINMAAVGGTCIVACLGSMVDNTPPTTMVSVPAAWDTTNFSTAFTDVDSGCLGGVSKSFYQVSDYNTGNDWRANNTHGFFNDDFKAPSINTDWTIDAGTWTINAGNYLQQLDESVTNSNIYAPLTQNLSDSYLYNWTGTMGGAGTSRRAGFHFFADQPDSTNRGNSYFVWFRLDDDKIQIYKVVNNSWGANPVKDTAYNFTANQSYDFKVIYNRISGLVNVYVNNVKSAEWVDSSPLSNGSYVSFRNASCTYLVDNFKVFRSRTTIAGISVGSGNANDIRYQNQSPSIPAGKISSVVTDLGGNISAIATQNINVDFTHPLPVSIVKDGPANDVDTTYNGSQLQANWATAFDINSGVTNYYYAIGTSIGGTDVVGWTSNGNNTSVTKTGLTLIHLQKYYFSIKADDGAMMKSSVVTSDGQLFFNMTTGINPITDLKSEITIYPNPNNGQFTINNKQFIGETKISIVDMLGREILTKVIAGIETEIDLSEQQKGLYYITITNNNKQYQGKVLVNK